jgi:hypothetical protein
MSAQPYGAIEYRRRHYTVVWHWCASCPDWPRADYETMKLRPSEIPPWGELDSECNARERRGECSGT